MSNTATVFPPQTYSSTFFLNSVNDETCGDGSAETRGHYFQNRDHNHDHPALLDCFIATMRSTARSHSHLWTKATALLSIILASISLATAADLPPSVDEVQCVDYMHSKVHYFIDLVDYANNQVGFDPTNAIHDGNWIGFTGNATATGILPNNSFVSNTSEYIRNIDLGKEYLTSIVPGAFNSLFCLKTLDLSYNNLTKIFSLTFAGLTHNMQELDLSYNQLSDLSNATFGTLTGLRKLNLSNNTIKYVNFWTFYNNTLLIELQLQNNFLHRVEGGALANLPHLQTLRLDNNKLDSLDVTSWTNSTKLSVLNISQNFLHTFSLGVNVSFKDLKELDLSFNQLIKLDVAQIELQLKQLGKIDLDGNNWFCDYLDSMMTLLRTHVVSYGTNTTYPQRNGIACIERFPSSITPTANPTSPIATSVPTSSSSAQTTSNVPSSSSSSDGSTSQAALSSSDSTGSTAATTSAADHTNDKYGAAALQLVGSVEQLQTSITILTVIVIAFVLVEIVSRSGLHRRIFKRRNSSGPLFDVNRTYNESENLALLRG